MCLILLNSRVESNIAAEDIEVFKAVIEKKELNLEMKIHGLRATASKIHKEMKIYGLRATASKIHTELKVDGKISIFDDEVYFCSNFKCLNGLPCPEKFEYTYSWQMDKSLINLKIFDSENNEITIEYIFKYLTFFRSIEVEIGETYESKLVKTYNEIEKGLHSFKSLEGAQSLSKTCVKCIIPKGSEYYEGYFDGFFSYASDKIKYVELV